jgi:3-oxoacyl-[acyl-carrier protein] reductase
MTRPSQPVALVTGTAQGIGRAIADQLEADGLVVLRTDRDEMDVTDAESVRAYVAGAPPIDVLVNSAGGVLGQVHQPLEDVTDEQWQAIIDVNLTGTFHCVRAVVGGMKQRGWGRIVTISSGAGRSVSLTGIQAYASAKAAQINFTRQMAHELGPYGITVNAIAPGFVLSNPTTVAQWESYGPQGQQKLVEGIALRRLGEASDIANGVAFFVSERASWITGQTLSIDGGSALF